ncbi:MAG: glycoside hydrolase family 5 protein [Fimbriimonadaceae bacterium]
MLVACALALAAAVSQAVPLTARNYLQRLSPGINLGNTMEALPNETAWGNPSPTDAYFKAVEAAGFRSVRIPIAWSQYSDKDQRINPKWMAHVSAVVHMAIQAGLYVMINIHWDGGWIQATYAKRDGVNAKLAKFWSQIASNFKGYDDRLLFAGTNEIGVEGVYGPPTPENAEVQNGYNQVFVNAVRAAGGKNASRWLVVQGYNTNIDDAAKVNAKMPADSAKGRLMMEVHYYAPYDFTLNDKSDIWQWGAKATDPKATEAWANEAYADAEFQSMKEAFVNKGVPVILGEYGAGMKQRFPGMRPFRDAWDRYVTHSSYGHGLVPMFWDTGGLFDRKTGAQKEPELIQTIVGAAK